MEPLRKGGLTLPQRGRDLQVENSCFTQYTLALSQMSKAALGMASDVSFFAVSLKPRLHGRSYFSCIPNYFSHLIFITSKSTDNVLCLQTWQPPCIAIAGEDSGLYRDPRGHLIPNGFNAVFPGHKK